MVKLRILIYSIVVLALVSACKEKHQLQEGKNAGIVKASSRNTQTSKLVYQRLHTFSDPVKPDTFRITLTGDSVLAGKALLEIIRHDGSILYQDAFAATYLIDYGIAENPSEQQKETYVLERAKNFFDDENFMHPALPEDRTFDPNYSDKKVWEAIKKDTTAIGFYYKLGKEDGKYLAYSKELNKVVLYFNCC